MILLLNLLINGVIFISKKAIISKTLIATLGAAGALAMSNTASADTNVQVQSGDTVWNFAQEYQTTVDSIAQRNQLANPNLIYVGQNLIIPDSATSAVTTDNTTAAASTGTAASTGVSTTTVANDTANTTDTAAAATTEYSTAAATNTATVTSEAADVATGNDTAGQSTSTADQTATDTTSAASASVASGATVTLNSTANTAANTTAAANTSAAPTTVSYEANSAAANQAMANYTIQYGSVDSSANSAQTVYQNAAAVNSSSQATTQAAGGSTQSTSAAVATARSMIGVPYVWGGNTPSGFDCSGLVQYAYNLGSNYRTTYQQTNLGQHKYDVENAQSGDLYFWGTESAPYHVAIAEGNGNYIQAPTPGQNVQEGNIQYYRPNFYISMNQ